MTADHLSAATRRRLARSPFAPLYPGGTAPMTQLRVDVLARLLAERLHSLGPLPEPDAIDVLEQRAPGQAAAAIRWARQSGAIRRVAGKDDEPATLEAVEHEGRAAA
jgi:hypothetical protein